MAELLDFTKPHVLRNDREYDAAVAEIDRLLDADPRPASEDHERLEFLSVLVEAYEDAHLPVEDPASPQDAIDFMLEQKGLSHVHLAQWLGDETQVNEFFQGTRPLSLRQIEILRGKLGIPADLLIQPALSALSA
jgi:HTH-type transcriptional regulator/antitoxin HigA